MGVKGLWKVLEPCGFPVDLTSLSGKILAVDISMWIHQSIAMKDSVGSPIANGHLMLIFNRLCKLLTYNIKPIFVFDGDVPFLKEQTIRHRRERRQQASDRSSLLRRKALRKKIQALALASVLGKKHPLTEIPSTSGDAVDNLFSISQEYQLELSDDNDDDDNLIDDLNNFDDVVTSYTSLMKVKNSPIIPEIRYSSESNYYSDIDTDGDDFKSLPIEIQHEILKNMKDCRKKSEYTNDSYPQTMDNFSAFQLSKLRKQGSITNKLLNLEERMQANNSDSSLYDIVEVNDSNLRFSKSKNVFRSDGVLSMKQLHKFKLIDDRKPHHFVTSNFGDRNSSHVMVYAKGPLNAVTDPESFFSSSLKTTTLHDERKNEDNIHESSESTPVKISKCETNISDVSVDIFDNSISNEVKVKNISSLQMKRINSVDEWNKEDNPHSPANIPEKSPSAEVQSLHTSLDKQVQRESPSNLTAIWTSNVKDDNYSDLYNTEKNVISVRQKDKKIVSPLPVQNSPVDEMTIKVESNKVITDTSLPRVKCNNDSLSREESDDSNAVSFITNEGNALDDGGGVRKIGSIVSSSILSHQNETKSVEFPETKFVKDSDEDSDDDEWEEVHISEKESDMQTPSDTGNISTFLRNFAERHEKENTFDDSSIFDQESNSLLNSEETSSKGKEELIDFLEKEKSRVENEMRVIQQDEIQAEHEANFIKESMYSDAQELLRYFGIPYMIAPGEAEAQCSFLDFSGKTNGSITDDSDTWLFGADTVYRNFFNLTEHVKRFRSADIIRNMGLTREQCIGFALISGSDYTEGIHNAGPVTALEILTEFYCTNDAGDNTDNGSGILNTLRDFAKWLRNVKKQKNDKVLKELVDNDVKKRLIRLNIDDFFPNETIIKAYLEPKVEQEWKTFSWKDPDLHSIQTFLNSKIGWSFEKVESILMPVLKSYNRMKISGKREKLGNKTITDFFSRDYSNLTDESNSFISRSKRAKIALEMLNNEKRKAKNLPRKTAALKMNKLKKKKKRITKKKPDFTETLSLSESDSD